MFISTHPSAHIFPLLTALIEHATVAHISHYLLHLWASKPSAHIFPLLTAFMFVEHAPLCTHFPPTYCIYVRWAHTPPHTFSLYLLHLCSLSTHPSAHIFPLLTALMFIEDTPLHTHFPSTYCTYVRWARTPLHTFSPLPGNCFLPKQTSLKLCNRCRYFITVDIAFYAMELCQLWVRMCYSFNSETCWINNQCRSIPINAGSKLWHWHQCLSINIFVVHHHHLWYWPTFACKCPPYTVYFQLNLLSSAAYRNCNSFFIQSFLMV